MLKAETIKEVIERCGSDAEAGRHLNVAPGHFLKLKKRGAVVIDGVIYTPMKRRGRV